MSQQKWRMRRTILPFSSTTLFCQLQTFRLLFYQVFIIKFHNLFYLIGNSTYSTLTHSSSPIFQPLVPYPLPFNKKAICFFLRLKLSFGSSPANRQFHQTDINGWWHDTRESCWFVTIVP